MWKEVNFFDKVCWVCAFAAGVALAILGTYGTFIGVRFWFTLPPFVAFVLFMAGYGIMRAVYFAWKAANLFGPEEAEVELETAMEARKRDMEALNEEDK